MRLLSWRECRRGTLLGFDDLLMDSGLVVRDVSFHAQNGSQWASAPGRPMFDADKNLVRDDAGKVAYSPMLDFVDKTTRRRWSDAAVAATLRHVGAAQQNAPGAGRDHGRLRAATGWAR